MERKKQLRFETLQLHAGQEAAEGAHGCRAVPIYQTTSYLFDDCKDAAARFALEKDGHMYTRISNPTNEIFEKRIAALECGVGAVAFSSGMAAVTAAILNIAGAGDNIVTSCSIYGGTFNLFANTFKTLNIGVKFVNQDDIGGFGRAIDGRTKAVYIESQGNPNCDIPDFDKIAEIARKNKIPLIVDSTFATPYLFKPFEHGADIIVHSATKFIGGHATSVGGVIVDGGAFDWEKSGKFPCLTEEDPGYHGVSYTKQFGKAAYITKARAVWLRDLGACASPFNSFLFLLGLETLSLRIERHNFNAVKIVEYLETRPEVAKINHPAAKGNPYAALAKKYFPKGAGSIFTIELKGGKAAAVKLVDGLKLFSHLANVADAKSLVICPAATTHGQMTAEQLKAAGMTAGTVRLSIGIENYLDLIDDLQQAFDKIK